MKRIMLTVCCLALVFSFAPYVYAADNNTVVSTTNEHMLSNGITVTEEITIHSQVRSNIKTASKTNTFTDGDTVIAVITIQATFQYDGNSVSVVSKSIIQQDTYNGWSFTQDSFASSGGTVTLKGTLKWLLLFNSSSCTMTLSCDKNGNIT